MVELVFSKYDLGFQMKIAAQRGLLRCVLVVLQPFLMRLMFI
jgi:hypothetical protein